MFEARLYKRLGKGMVKCLACSWKCKIADGKAGVCGVRKNEKGKLFLLVYGRPTGVAIDPIEKKPLYHFLPGTGILSLGTIGCNFKCEFCQNWFESQKREIVSEFVGPEEIVKVAVENRTPSIAFTYNEQTIWTEYAVEIMKIAKKLGIYGVYVSNGYMTNETLDYLESYIDAYNIDLKSFSEEYYQKICHARLEPVLKNIKEIYKRKKWLEISTMLIPGRNDTDWEIRKMAEFICRVSSTIQWHIFAARPEYKMMEIKAMTRERLIEVEEIGRKVGLKYVYGGKTIRPDYKEKMEGVWE